VKSKSNPSPGRDSGTGLKAPVPPVPVSRQRNGSRDRVGLSRDCPASVPPVPPPALPRGPRACGFCRGGPCLRTLAGVCAVPLPQPEPRSAPTGLRKPAAIVEITIDGRPLAEVRAELREWKRRFKAADVPPADRIEGLVLVGELERRTRAAVAVARREARRA
jgi:hypothetical protein